MSVNASAFDTSTHIQTQTSGFSTKRRYGKKNQKRTNSRRGELRQTRKDTRRGKRQATYRRMFFFVLVCRLRGRRCDDLTFDIGKELGSGPGLRQDMESERGKGLGLELGFGGG